MRVGRAGAVLVAGMLLIGCSGDGERKSSESETTDKCGLEAGGKCAPESRRVDRDKPVFSHPTEITNPLFPTSTLTQVIQLGQEAGDQERVEATLMPGTRVIEWNGQKVETVIRQFIAYAGPRIVEVALDYFAQADDGAVWYFGEDVFNYENGVVANMGGTWLAGKDGPAGMIMPAAPKAGDVYRPENIPGLVFEEVTVRAVDQAIEGPRGPVPGGITTREHLMEGDFEDKAFAPGYGESRIQAEDEFVQVALAVPTDAVPGAPPAELTALSSGAATIFEAAGQSDWTAASTALETVNSAWSSYQASEVPKLLGSEVGSALKSVSEGVGAKKVAGTRQGAVDLARAALDLELRHRPPAEIDRDRLGAWGRQVLVHAEAGDAGAVAGDVAVLETIRNRMAHTLDPPDAARLGQILTTLRRAADAKDRAAAGDAVPALLGFVAGLGSAER